MERKLTYYMSMKITVSCSLASDYHLELYQLITLVYMLVNIPYYKYVASAYLVADKYKKMSVR